MSEARHIPLDAARMTVNAAFRSSGSIIAGTAEHRLDHVATTLELESTAPREAIAGLVEQAERMCYVMNAVQQPHEIVRRVTLNGDEM